MEIVNFQKMNLITSIPIPKILSRYRLILKLYFFYFIFSTGCVSDRAKVDRYSSDYYYSLYFRDTFKLERLPQITFETYSPPPASIFVIRDSITSLDFGVFNHESNSGLRFLLGRDSLTYFIGNRAVNKINFFTTTTSIDLETIRQKNHAVKSTLFTDFLREVGQRDEFSNLMYSSSEIDANFSRLLTNTLQTQELETKTDFERFSQLLPSVFNCFFGYRTVKDPFKIVKDLPNLVLYLKATYHNAEAKNKAKILSLIKDICSVYENAITYNQYAGLDKSGYLILANKNFLVVILINKLYLGQLDTEKSVHVRIFSLDHF